MIDFTPIIFETPETAGVWLQNNHPGYDLVATNGVTIIFDKDGRYYASIYDNGAIRYKS